jgi:hypothetical protein
MEDSRMDIDELLPEIPTPDWESIRDDNAVGEAAFELLKAAAIYAHLAAGLLPIAGYTRDEAILGGLVLKVSKLGKAMVAMSAQLGSDRQLALAREVIEALAILAYLTADTDGARFDAYVQDSLVAEREFLRLVNRNVDERDSSWPIEESMTRSIERTARDAGVAEVAALPGRRSIGWPSMEVLLDLLGPNIYPSYRVGSSVLHTRWLDLIRHHIRRETDGTFTLRFEDDHPRAEPLYGVGVLIIDGVRRYLERLRPEALPRFTAGLDQLEHDFVRLVQAHSEMLDASDDNMAG